MFEDFHANNQHEIHKSPLFLFDDRQLYILCLVGSIHHHFLPVQFSYYDELTECSTIIFEILDDHFGDI